MPQDGRYRLARVGVAGSSPVVRSSGGVRKGPSSRVRLDWRRGGVAEWSGKGLQNPVHRFDSGPRLDQRPTWGTMQDAMGA
jgi:hypothetical protein